MRTERAKAPKDAPVARIYIAAVTLKEFRNKNNVEVQLFRLGATQEELDAYRSLGLVGDAPADLPAEILAGATEDAALACLLEAFTENEADELEKYLQTRYSGLIETLVISPMNLPAPLGVGPLAQIPETDTAGFINFDQAPGYPLPFAFRGYYDLNA